MKIIKVSASLLAIFILFSFGACKKTDISDVKPLEEKSALDNIELNFTNIQNAIGFNYTSTGCSGCGSWGIPTFENLAKTENYIPITAHIKYGDPMITSISNALGDNRTGRRFTPQIYIGNIMAVVLSNGGGIIGSSSVAKMNSEIAKKKAEKAVALTSAKYILSDDQIEVKFGTKFLEDLSGEYYLSCLLLEDDIVFGQSGGSSDFIHNNTIRENADGLWGKAIPANELIKDGIFSSIHKFDLDAKYNKDNLHLVTILWKKDGSNYQYINCQKAEKL